MNTKKKAIKASTRKSQKRPTPIAKVHLLSSPSWDAGFYAGYTEGTGIWRQRWGGWPDGMVNQRSIILASICEVRVPDNVAQVGSAFVSIGQIVPADDNTVTFVLSCNSDKSLYFRVNMAVITFAK